MFKMYWFLFILFFKYCHFISTTFWASCKLYYHLFFPSRLCSAGVPWRSEADPDGGDEDAGSTGRRRFHSEGVSTHNGDSHGGGSAAWNPNAQAQTERYEHPDALRLLRTQAAWRADHRSHEMMTSSCLVQCIPVLLFFFIKSKSFQMLPCLGH